MRPRDAFGLAFGLALGLAGGCSDYDPKGWLVDRTRVIGARTEAASDPGRASLEPGENATVTWLIVSPGRTPRLSFSFAACIPPDGNYATSRCDGPVLTSGTGTSDGELVAMPFATPPTESTGDAPELLLLAAFCEGETPVLDPRSFTATCAGGSAPLLAATRLRLAKAGPNRSPSIADDAIRLGDATLPPAAFSVPAGPCEGAPDAPVVQAGAKDLKLHVRLDDRERELGPEGREGLLLSHLVTDGELERQYSSIEPAEPAPKDVTIELTVPSTVDGGGRLLRFFFVLRDDRGAMGFAARAICVRP